MSLPELKFITYEFEVPSSKQKIICRPYLVKEEKVLLMAKESNDIFAMIRAVKDVIQACVMEPSDFDSDDLALFDLGYLFLKLREVSVDNIIRISFIDEVDDEKYNYEIRIADIEIIGDIPSKESRIVELKHTQPESQIFLRVPKASSLKTTISPDDTEAMSNYFVSACIESLIVGDEVYLVKDMSESDLKQLVDSLPVSALKNINDFYNALPSLRYVLKHKRKDGTIIEYTYNKVEDFFDFA